MCKGFTSTSFAFIKGGDLKPLKMSSFSLSLLIVSWRTPRNLSSLTPLNPARGDYGHDKIDGLKNGSNASVD
jgi:hypothetical protein